MQLGKNKKGAGFLVFKDFNGEKKVLILLDRNGKFDIPKGHVDSGDIDRFATAQRECFEETQIFVSLQNLLTNDVYNDKHLTVFCAETTQEPTLMANPESGEVEHLRFYWLHPDTAAVVLPDYLSNALMWGVKYVV